MGYPALGGRVAIRGTVDGGEIWETTHGLQNILTGGQAELQALADRIATHFNNRLGGPMSALMLASQHFTEIAVYEYNTGGSIATRVATSPITGAGSGTSTHPLQTACCVTLQTGAAGRSNRGRMYLPASGAGLQSTSLFQRSDLVTLLAAMASYFEDVANDTTASATPSVISLKGSTGRQITSLKVDLRPDVQRRRANKQASGVPVTQAVAL